MIIIDMDMNKPEDNYEAISIIFNKGIVPEGMADNLTKIVGLRNALVHEYEDIDNSKIYDVLVNRLEAMDEFENVIRKYIS
ncbi:MAG: HepT-like ribonuclease domain-containing protein [Minisyncoccales bacterium]